MKYIVHTKNNYVVGLELNNEGIEVDDEILSSEYLICYKFINGEFIFDEEKKNKLIQDELNRQEIEVLRKNLQDTDYIWNVINEKDHDEEYYADVIANRHTWRMRIRELEEQIKGEN